MTDDLVSRLRDAASMYENRDGYNSTATLFAEAADAIEAAQERGEVVAWRYMECIDSLWRVTTDFIAIQHDKVYRVEPLYSHAAPAPAAPVDEQDELVEFERWFYGNGSNANNHCFTADYRLAWSIWQAARAQRSDK